jgi:hypothetical protein
MDRQDAPASARSAGKPSPGTQQRRWLSGYRQDPAPVVGRDITSVRPDTASHYHSVGLAGRQCRMPVHPVSAVESRVLVRVCHNPPRLQQRSLCRKHPWVGVDRYPAHTRLMVDTVVGPCILTFMTSAAAAQVVYLTTVSAAAGCAEPSSRLAHKATTDAAFPAWSRTARAALATLRWQTPAQGGDHACGVTETVHCRNAGIIAICWASWCDRATLQASHFVQ